MVTSNSEAAIRFYQELGFTRTGRTEPYPNDPRGTEYEMWRTPQTIGYCVAATFAVDGLA